MVGAVGLAGLPVAPVQMAVAQTSPVERPETPPGKGPRPRPPVDDTLAPLPVPSDPRSVPVVRAERSSFDPSTSVELPDRRSEFESVYRNADGSEAVVLTSAPSNYSDDGGRSWKKIDSRLVAGADGTLSNVANAWTVRFGRLDEGVSFATVDGTLSWRGVESAGVQPTLEPDGESVRYADAWPGVDVVYRVSNGGVEELIELRGPNSTDSVSFDLAGVELVAAPDSGFVSRSGPKVKLSALQSYDKQGKGVDKEGATSQKLVGNRMSIGVNKQWLRTLPADRFPITLDPTFTPVGNAPVSYRANNTSVSDGFLRVGDETTTTRWQGMQSWQVSSQYGKSVTNASLTLTPSAGAAGSHLFEVYWGHVNGFHVSGGNMPRIAVPFQTIYPLVYPNSWLQASAWGGAARYLSGNLSTSGGAQTFSSTTFTQFWDYMLTAPRPAGVGLQPGMLFRGNEATTAVDWKKFTATLVLTTNTAPVWSTQPSSPPDSARLAQRPSSITTNGATDGDAHPLSYRLEISDDSTFTDVVFTGGWQSVVSGTLKWDTSLYQYLEPGETYWWRVVATDTYDMAPSSTKQFVWDPDPFEAPSDQQGPFSVNLATGQMTTSISSPSFSAVGGAIGMSLDYDSHDYGRFGLKAHIVKDTNGDRLVSAGEPTVFRQIAPMIDYSWGSGGPTSDAVDAIAGQWTGVITPPAGTWRIGVQCDEKARVTIASTVHVEKLTGVCTNVATPGAVDWASLTFSGSQSITVAFAEVTGAAMIKLWVQPSTSPTEVSTIAVPQDWLSQGGRILPAGWTMDAGPGVLFNRVEIDNDSLVVYSPDGTPTTFTRSAGSTSTEGWIPEDGEHGHAIRATDGTVTVDHGSMIHVFNPDGSLRQAVTTIDDQNRNASALYEYETSGRLLKVKDPVSGRELRLIYQGQSGCAASQIPTGFLCAVQFAASSSATPETWSTLQYNSAAANGNLISFTNPGGARTDFDYLATGPYVHLFGIRGPLANDVLAAGVRTDALPIRWEATIDFPGSFDGIPYTHSILHPAESQGAPQRYQIAYGLGVGFADFNLATQRATRVTVTDNVSSPPSGYLAQYDLDGQGRAAAVRDGGGRTSTVVYNTDGQVTTSTAIDGSKSFSIFDAAGSALEQWGPVPSSSTACVADLTARATLAPHVVAASTTFPANCSAVPFVKTDYDYDAANGYEYRGLDVTWWATSTAGATTAEPDPALNFVGVNGAGTLDANWGSGGPTGLKNNAGTTVTDNFSANITGVIEVPTTGIYKFKLVGDDSVTLWLDDVLKPLTADWSGDVALTAGQRVRIRVQYVELTGNASLSLRWLPPGGSEEVIPGQYLHPDYGFPTRVRTYETAGGVAEVQVVELPTPQYGAASEVGPDIVAGAGSGSMSTSFVNESPGGTGWGRRVTRTLPAGNSWTYQYWGDTEGLGSATCGVSSGTNQAGQMRRRLGPDPDDAGAQKRRIEEFVYDVYGRQRGSRVGLEGATVGTLDASVPWTCVTTIDSRWRVTQVDYPSHDIYGARTVLIDYAKGSNPLVGEICDNNVAGSPTASSGVCAGKNGVITSTVDILGRSTVYTDVWAQSTSSFYGLDGRLQSRQAAPGTFNELYTYDSENRLSTISFDVGGGSGYQPFATVGYGSFGEMNTVTYGNGTALADLDGVGRRFPDRSIQELTFTGPAGTITSSTITSRDRNGRVLGESIDGAHYAYGYDDYDRLVRVQTSGAVAAHDYQFCFQDVFGVSGAPEDCKSTDVSEAGKNSNRTAAYDNHVKVAGYSYDLADRLTGVSVQAPYAGNAIGYDARGNTVALAGETLRYDGADRHMSTVKAAIPVSYLRDATDRIVGRMGPDGTQRFTFTGGGDSAGAVLSSSNVVLQRTLGLPGGVMVTVQVSGNVWSYPNVQGSVTATANQAGVKQGGSSWYDPFGNPLGSIPDNVSGSMDYGWLGQYQRPFEHTAGLRNQIEMGARGYDPVLGRFLEVDPVEGGVDNDYGYVTDSRNSTDLRGMNHDIIQPKYTSLGSIYFSEDAFSGLNVGGLICVEHLGSERQEVFSKFGGSAPGLEIRTLHKRSRPLYKVGVGLSVGGLGKCWKWKERRDGWTCFRAFTFSVTYWNKGMKISKRAFFEAHIGADFRVKRVYHVFIKMLDCGVHSIRYQP